jgi:hypothetical protein
LSASFPVEHHRRIRHSNFIERTFGETRLAGQGDRPAARRSKLPESGVGRTRPRLAGLARHDDGPTGTRLLNDTRHQLLDPPTPLRPTDTTKITGAAKLSGPSPNMTTEEPSRSSFTPTVGRNPF